MIRVRAFVLLAGLLVSLSGGQAALGAYGAYLHIDGIPGESTVEGREDWIDLLAVAHGLSRAGDAGGGASQARLSNVTLIKHLDKSTPLLMEACASGRHFPEAVIDFVREGADTVRFYRVRLKDVIIHDVELSGNANAGRTVEPLSLGFRSIEWSYTEFDADGVEVAEHLAWWDLESHTGDSDTLLPGSGSSPVPDGFRTRVLFSPIGGDGTRGALTWISRSGATYGVYYTSDLNEPFDTLVLTVPSEGDGVTSATIDLPGDRGFFIIRELE